MDGYLQPELNYAYWVLVGNKSCHAYSFMVPGYSTGIWECNLAGIKHQEQQPQPQYPWRRENCNLMEAMVGLLKDSVLSSFWHVVSMWWRGNQQRSVGYKRSGLSIIHCLAMCDQEFSSGHKQQRFGVHPSYLPFLMILDPICTICVHNFHFHLFPLIYTFPAFHISQIALFCHSSDYFYFVEKLTFLSWVHWQWGVVERAQTLALALDFSPPGFGFQSIPLDIGQVT